MHEIMAPIPSRPRVTQAESVRGRRAFFFLTEGLHGQIMVVGFGSPCRSDQSHPVRAGVSFPAQSFVSRPKFLPAPVLHIWIAPIFCCCLFCHRDPVAMV